MPNEAGKTAEAALIKPRLDIALARADVSLLLLPAQGGGVMTA
jgi:hypothetical protein